MEGLLTIGKIVNTHGIKGECKVKPITDKLETFDRVKSVYIVGRETKVYEIASTRMHKEMILIKFKGIETMNEAELLKNAELKISKEDSIPLEEDEYYIGDLYGLKVFTEEQRFLGEIIDVLLMSSNDVYVVKHPETQKEILIPAIKQCIKNVNVEEGTMKVALLEGLES